MKNYLLITILFIFSLAACSDNEPLSIATTNKAGSAGSAGKMTYNAGQSGSAGINVKPMPIPVDILVPRAFDQISIIEDMMSNIGKTNWYNINSSYYQELIVSDINVGTRE